MPPSGGPRSWLIVIVDHGSRRQEANRRHEEFVREWRGPRALRVVEPAHMELAEPSIATAFDACVAAGATTVVIAPYFLWPGDHWDRDIPALAAEACGRHPGVRYLVAAPLGPHPLLGDIVEERVGPLPGPCPGRGTRVRPVRRHRALPPPVMGGESKN